MKKMAEITLRMVQNFLEFKRDMNFQIKSAFQMPNRININRHIRVKLQTLKVKKKKRTNIKVTQRNKHVAYKEITIRSIADRSPTTADPNIFMILIAFGLC